MIVPCDLLGMLGRGEDNSTWENESARAIITRVLRSRDPNSQLRYSQLVKYSEEGADETIVPQILSVVKNYRIVAQLANTFPVNLQ